MTNNKQTKRALLSSALSLVLCFAMLLGTTFAWFTDTASTAVNKIQSGTLDVALEMWDGEKWVNAEGKTLSWQKAEGHETEEVLWEPGATYELQPILVKNNGNLALKYEVAVTGITGDAKLNEAIDWEMDFDLMHDVSPLGEDETEESVEYLLPEEYKVIYIAGHMREDAGNEYQGLSIESIAITVVATQAQYEYDSEGNTYDKDAEYPDVWDGKTETAPTKTDGVYHITNAAEFAQYINELNNAPVTGEHRYDKAKVVLDSDIDLGGAVLNVSGEGYMFSGSFDGNGHTVSNFTVERTDGSYYTGLFSAYMSSETNAIIKNLTVKNGTVISNGKQVAAIVPSVNENATIENCHAIGCVVSGVKKVGAVAGYVEGSSATVKDCSAKDCSVAASHEDDNDVNLFGYDNGGTFAGNVDNGGNALTSGE